MMIRFCRSILFWRSRKSTAKSMAGQCRKGVSIGSRKLRRVSKVKCDFLVQDIWNSSGASRWAASKSGVEESAPTPGYQVSRVQVDREPQKAAI